MGGEVCRGIFALIFTSGPPGPCCYKPNSFWLKQYKQKQTVGLCNFRCVGHWLQAQLDPGAQALFSRQSLASAASVLAR